MKAYTSYYVYRVLFCSLEKKVKCQDTEEDKSIFLVHIFNLLPPPPPLPHFGPLHPIHPNPNTNKHLFSPKSSACWKQSLGTIHAGK